MALPTGLTSLRGAAAGSSGPSLGCIRSTPVINAKTTIVKQLRPPIIQAVRYGCHGVASDIGMVLPAKGYYVA